MKRAKKEKNRFVTKCIGCFLVMLIFCPGLISLFVGYAIGYTFYTLMVLFCEKYMQYLCFAIYKEATNLVVWDIFQVLLYGCSIEIGFVSGDKE